MAEYYNYEVCRAAGSAASPRGTNGTLNQARNDAANGDADHPATAAPADPGTTCTARRRWTTSGSACGASSGCRTARCADLQPLPDRTAAPDRAGATRGRRWRPGEPLNTKPPQAVNTCPVDAPVRTYDVAAINQDIVYNAKTGDHDPAGAMYVLTADEAAVRAGTKPTEPLFLRANAGDCLKVTLTNKLPAGGLPAHTGDVPLPADAPFPSGNRVSLHAAMVDANVTSADGATVGYNFDQTVAPGAEHHRLLVRAGGPRRQHRDAR